MRAAINDPYQTFGRGYGLQRRPDPRIQALVNSALGDATTVVNVGAGTGSYEPVDRRVLAVEPSVTMLAQRPPGAAPAVRATAEAIPLADRAVDVGLAILTVHHWVDAENGLDELVRVSRRQVVLTWDPAMMSRSFWLISEYLPEIGRREAGAAALGAVTAGLSRHYGEVEVRPVPVPADCTDSFLAAHWRRPHAYLDPAVRAAASGIAALPPEVVGAAMQHLTDDLAGGRWQQRHHDLLEREDLDLGYRLVIT
ncbi:class I SAM-dependent methyltransferase [Pseudonocardia sp. CA-142604]|uniref:class I SAM-dependent methyltransferase n=1 Tax=Pseudonocardia sp. CA-142604 TaxID=3240024 RepID=UPI003D9080FA